MAKNGYPFTSVTEMAPGRHLIGQNPLLPDDGHKPAGYTRFWLFDLQRGTRKYRPYPKMATNTRALRPTDHIRTPLLPTTVRTRMVVPPEVLTSFFPLTGGCSEGLGAFCIFFKKSDHTRNSTYSTQRWENGKPLLGEGGHQREGAQKFPH